MVKAKDPKGLWTELILVKSGKGIIDPCPFGDEDGKVYMVHAYDDKRAELHSILSIYELNAEVKPSRNRTSFLMVTTPYLQGTQVL